MPLIYFRNQIYRGGIYADITTGAMILAVANAEKKLKEHGIGDEPITRNWKDPDIMKQLKSNIITRKNHLITSYY